MSANIGQSASPFAAPPWQVEAAQLLEEHHLVAWAPQSSLRERFGSEIALSLAGFDDTEVCELPGASIQDIFSFCTYLERFVHNRRVRRSVDAKGGVVESLRSVAERSSPAKRRFFIWHDAHVLLRHDHRLFGRLADALMGVSAELEYTSEDRLVIQRAIFIGAPSLDMYAEDSSGQFRCWFSEDREEPLWATITGVAAPPVLRYRIDPVVVEPRIAAVQIPGTSRARPARDRLR